MLSDRQDKILKIIVAEHIRTAQPIGSKTIQELLDVEISSATIRNDAAILEEQGFLEKSHTSSGRIPSTKGYRYYVDNLMDKNDVNDLKAKINIVFEDRSKSIEQVLDMASDIISEMTNLAAFVSTGVDESVTSLRKIELISVSDKSAAVVIVLSNGRVENKIFNLDNVTLNDLKIAIDFFDRNLLNVPISEIPEKLEQLQPIFSKVLNKTDVLFQSLISAIAGFDMKKFQSKGFHYMLANPEFNNPEKIKYVLSLLENVSPFKWLDIQIKRNNLDNVQSNSGTKLLIGSETGIGNDDLSIIEKEITTKTGEIASIALVGPKRMDYDKIIELLDWIAKKIFEEFGNTSEGGVV